MSMDVNTWPLTCVILLTICMVALTFVVAALVLFLVKYFPPELFNNQEIITMVDVDKDEAKKSSVVDPSKIEDNPWERARIDSDEFEKTYPTMPEEREIEK